MDEVIWRSCYARRRRQKAESSRQKAEGSEQTARAKTNKRSKTKDQRSMLLVIDNYDSFTYNLVQYLGELGERIEVRRNDEITIDEIESTIRPDRIVISPGPGTPDDAGRSEEHTSELQSRGHLVCRLLLEKKKTECWNFSVRVGRC